MTFDVILADPPWNFRVWNEATGSGRSASRHYQIMDVEDICALNVRDFRARNCALFLWVTWPTIFKYAPLVMKAWGFKYRTEAWTWIKPTKSGDGWKMGTGYYTRANSEPCLLAVRGSMPVADHGILGLISEPISAHSAKPHKQYEIIEALYPGARYLELFARPPRRDGWAVWGNEMDSDINLEMIHE